ncbi:hypothetical protein HZA55_05455 [Candidatus Poribacteria bacterium]|nr:hypothetical protein [Candidatus Poribacteria bacterium]
MKKNSKLAVEIIFFFVLTFALSCGKSNDTANSEDVNENKIYGDYRSVFDANTNTIEFYAQFRLAGKTGTTLKLTSPGKIEMDNNAMNLQDGEVKAINLAGTYYSLIKIATAPNSTYTFKWTKTDNTTYSNVMTYARPVTISSPLADSTYSKLNNLTVVFEGDDIQSDELVWAELISLNLPAQGETPLLIALPIKTGKEITFTALALSKFVSGNAKILLQRQRVSTPATGHDNSGGNIASWYIAKPRNIVIQ